MEEIVGEPASSDTIIPQESELASMLHTRYTHIRMCPLEKDSISHEITLFVKKIEVTFLNTYSIVTRDSCTSQ